MSRVLSLCTGYGGLEGGLTLAGVDVELTAVADISPGAVRLLAHHQPHVPNLGDITAVDWSEVEPPDILTAGFPCQDVSVAGQRAGIQKGNRSGLWLEVAWAINNLRPRAILIENVGGLLSARADSHVERCRWCLGDDDDKPAVRALGAVLGDLSDLGYDARWVTVAAAEVGACHRRRRVFILAADTSGIGHGNPWAACLGRLAPAAVTGGVGAERLELLPTPAARLGERWGMPDEVTAERRMGVEGRRNLEDALALLPTPAATRSGRQRSPSPGAAIHPSLDMITALLPTPTVQHHARNATANRRAPKPTTCTTSWTLGDVAYADMWGKYAPAIQQQEQAFGRMAPAPTEPAKKGGRPNLSPRFVEWMMGLPEGWVTAVPGMTRNEQLTILGNGVVAQQAAHAIRQLVLS